MCMLYTLVVYAVLLYIVADSEQTKAVKAHYESRLAELDRDLKEARASAGSQAASESQIGRVQMENSELQAKVC